MLARLQNQLKNNADISAACSVMAGLDRKFRSKIQTAIMQCNDLADPRTKPAKTNILELSPKNRGSFAVQVLTLPPNL